MNKKSNLNKIEKDIKLNLECIKHWTENSLGETHSFGPLECAFCMEYKIIDNDEDDEEYECLGCPIYNKTGQILCRETPYEDILSINESNKEESKLKSLDELNFLFEILNGLIKLRDKLKEEIEEEEEKEKNKFKVGDYIKLKDGIRQEDIKYGWPTFEVFPNTIFKIYKIHDGNEVYVTGYQSNQLTMPKCGRVQYSYSMNQFEKVTPELKLGSIIVIPERGIKGKVHTKIEAGGKKYSFVENLKINEHFLINENLDEVDEKDKYEIIHE